MTPIEIIAFIVLIAAAVKIIVLLINPKSWMKAVKPFYKNQVLITIIALILAAAVLYYLINSGITIVQIFAVMAFVALVACISVAAYAGELFAMADKMLKGKKILKKAWLSIVVWIILVVWGFLVLFGYI